MKRIIIFSIALLFHFSGYSEVNKFSNIDFQVDNTNGFEKSNATYIILHDCLVSSVPHIVLIDTDNNQVSINDYNTRRVKVIHNYFGYNNNQSTITTLSNNQQYVKGNWNRTLKGPYRHANLLLSNTTVGRFYLWY